MNLIAIKDNLGYLKIFIPWAIWYKQIKTGNPIQNGGEMMKMTSPPG